MNDFLEREFGQGVNLTPRTQFVYSTSGSASSIQKYNDAFRQMELSLAYFSFTQEVTPEQYASMLRSPICRGGAVTGRGGLKSEIIPFLDEVETLALQTRAVNTVVNKEGKLYGYNTDTYGLEIALRHGLSEHSAVEVKTAVVYGNGGVSGVALRVLQQLGIQATIVGRNPQRVQQKLKELGINSLPPLSPPFDLVVDATSISSSPDFLQAPYFQSLLEGCKMVFCHNMPEKDGNVNYLAKYCEDEQLPFIAGRYMYEAQHIKQYALLLEGLKDEQTGLPIDEARIREVMLGK